MLYKIREEMTRVEMVPFEQFLDSLKDEARLSTKSG